MEAYNTRYCRWWNMSLLSVPDVLSGVLLLIQEAGEVSLYLRNLQEGEQKLIVGKGKVKMVTKGAPQPNGSGFNIALDGNCGDVLDPTSVVVGRVVKVITDTGISFVSHVLGF